MNADAHVLVATDESGDALLIRQLLEHAFSNVSVFPTPKDAASEAGNTVPDAIILAFKDLEKSLAFYVDFLSLCPILYSTPHCAVVLCSKETVRDAYDLCRAERFDDYVLFWPLTYDTYRLPMAVQCGLRHSVLRGELSRDSALLSQAEVISDLEPLLEECVADGKGHVTAVEHTLKQASADILDAFDHLAAEVSKSRQPQDVDTELTAQRQSEMKKLRKDSVETHLRSVNNAMHTLNEWIEALPKNVAPKIETASRNRLAAGNRKPYVLVVDDDIFQCRWLQQFLEDEKIEVAFALSGTRAFALVQRRRPDLILMDLEMPDMNGIEVIKRLKSLDAYANIPIIMITGNSKKETVVESLKAGALDFIVKPFDKKIVQEKLHRVFLGLGKKE